eukprot:gb/GECG01004335.1/.p1 GENE.gb/GECG01004335.1/~~gb/GECG01004335.1/.p1  ORF type:complete len:134 (+),score=15.64 gb/GECG01004335.1/:1-402(+)
MCRTGVLTSFLFAVGSVVYDPKVKEESVFMELEYTCGLSEKTYPGIRKHVTMVNDPYKAVDSCHAIAVMTEWNEFKDYDYAKMYEMMPKPGFLFDGRNILNHDKLRDIGFEVYGIGRFGGSKAEVESHQGHTF